MAELTGHVPIEIVTGFAALKTFCEILVEPFEFVRHICYIVSVQLELGYLVEIVRLSNIWRHGATSL